MLACNAQLLAYCIAVVRLLLLRGRPASGTTWLCPSRCSKSFFAKQVPDRAAVQRLAAQAAQACERAIEGLPDEWMYHMFLGKMRAKCGVH